MPYLKIPEDYFNLIGPHTLENGEIVQVTLLTINLLAKIEQTEKCTMTNAQFADLFNCSRRTISRAITVLKELNFIISEEEIIEHEYYKVPAPIRVLKSNKEGD